MPGFRSPSAIVVTTALTGISPANSPARSAPMRPSASYQSRNAPTVTTTVRYARPAASAAVGTRSTLLPSATSPAASSIGTDAAAEYAGKLERLKKFVVDSLNSGKLKPIVAKTFSGLDQIVEAHRYLESNQQIGKIVVTI